MAMIFEAEVERQDVEAVAEFMRSDGDAEVPSLGEKGMALLDALTVGGQESLWHVIVGRFVEYSPGGELYLTPEGESVTHADALYGKDNQPTGRWGVVREDYERPLAAYIVGVPI